MAENLDHIRFDGSDAEISSAGADSSVRLGQEAMEELQSQDAVQLFASRLDRDFSELDADGNGFIDFAEIDAKFVDPANAEEDVPFLVTLKAERRELVMLMQDGASEGGRFDERGISRQDAEELARLAGDPEYRDHLMALMDDADSEEQLDAMLKLKAYDKVAGVPSEDVEVSDRLYADQDNPRESIRPEAIRQGMIYDCYFQSSLASLAEADPQSIMDMIQFDEETGLYSVTFPGDPDNPVSVSAPTDMEQSYFSGGSPDGMWPTLIQKACGEYFSEDKGSLLPSDELDRIRFPGEVLELLTGGEAQRLALGDTNQDYVHQVLEHCMEEGCAISAGNMRSNNNGLSPGHAYSVLDYDAATRTVTLRNPRGKGEWTDDEGLPADGVADGIFQMPLPEFCTEFYDFTYASGS